MQPKLILLALLTWIVACAADARSSAASDYTEIEVRDVSFGAIKRFSAKIVVLPGHSRDEVRAILENAGRTLAERTRAGAVIILAYRAQDEIRGGYTVGTTTYAPGGNWARAGGDADMQAVTELNDLYFHPPKPRPVVGDTVVLMDSLGEDVLISDEYGQWGDANVVALVKPGTKAIVLEVRSEAMGSYEFVRYRIRTVGAGNPHTGWVHDFDARPVRQS